jgi:hypothetical protein
MEPSPETPPTSAERRTVRDRRAQATVPFSLASMRGSRKTIRRKEDTNTHYADLYSTDEVLLFILILMLSVADAFFTLELIGGRMKEWNSVMAYYLELGPLPFVIIKYLMTAVGLIFLIINKNSALFHRRIKVKAVIVAVAVMYTALIAYEVLLFRDAVYFSTLALSMTTGLTGTF